LVYTNNTCEKFDIKNEKWTKLGSMKAEERQKPILYITGMWLYAFFGYQAGNYVDSIERLNIKTAKGKWESVPFTNNSKERLGMIGSAIIEKSEDEIYLLGGKNNAGVRRDVFSFNFTTAAFTLCEFKMEEGSFFNESVFLKLNEKDHALFNENGNQVLKLNLN